MTTLFERIRACAAAGNCLISVHADDQLRERSITVWQVLAGLEQGRLLGERPASRPNPTIEVEQVLADGTPVKAVWAYIRALNTAKLVTVHFFDR